jgi:hypothetical protein
MIGLIRKTERTNLLAAEHNQIRVFGYHRMRHSHLHQKGNLGVGFVGRNDDIHHWCVGEGLNVYRMDKTLPEF